MRCSLHLWWSRSYPCALLELRCTTRPADLGIRLQESNQASVIHALRSETIQEHVETQHLQSHAHIAACLRACMQERARASPWEDAACGAGKYGPGSSTRGPTAPRPFTRRRLSMVNISSSPIPNPCSRTMCVSARWIYNVTKPVSLKATEKQV